MELVQLAAARAPPARRIQVRAISAGRNSKTEKKEAVNFDSRGFAVPSKL